MQSLQPRRSRGLQLGQSTDFLSSYRVSNDYELETDIYSIVFLFLDVSDNKENIALNGTTTIATGYG